ncbi:MAG TPA: helix-turn-helix transcriptional regulator [Mycobacteriales bacterium]|nr:helix-turn-helix transcriptional regulator [Mycobacteriales bacterium]
MGKVYNLGPRDVRVRPSNVRLRLERTGRGLTQSDVANAIADLAWQQLGIHVGVDAGMVSKWERGEKIPNRTYRRLISQVFGLAERDLGLPALGPEPPSARLVTEDGGPYPDRFTAGATPLGGVVISGPSDGLTGDPVTPSPVHYIRSALARGSFDLELNSMDDLPPMKLSDGRDAVNRAWAAFQSSAYADLAQQTPRLLGMLHRAARTLDGQAHLDAMGLLAEAYQVLTYSLTKLGDPQAAWLASERGMVAARVCEDDLILGGTAAVMSYALRESGHAAEAEQLCVSTAASLEPTMVRADRGRLSIYGLLLLKGSVAAARAGNRDRAARLLALADETARRLGADFNYHHTAFGPTSVRLYRVAVAVELGDGGVAVDEARKIVPSQIIARERSAHLLIDVARGYGQWGKPRKALATLLAAERVAPEEVWAQPNARRLAVDLRRHDVVGNPDLKDLIVRIGADRD